MMESLLVCVALFGVYLNSVATEQMHIISYLFQISSIVPNA